MSHRVERVGDQIRAGISRLLLRGVKDPRLGFVTVTGVKVSRDLRSARVYVSVLGDEEERTRSMEALVASTGYLRRELGRTLGLRFTPELHFHADLSIEQGSRIEEILGDIASSGEPKDQDD